MSGFVGEQENRRTGKFEKWVIGRKGFNWRAVVVGDELQRDY